MTVLQLIKKYNLGELQKTYVSLFDETIDMKYSLETLSKLEVVNFQVNLTNNKCKIKCNAR